MSAKAAAQKNLKEEKANHEKEILSLKKVMDDYKVERKSDWKSFKSKMNEEIEKIQKSIGGKKK